MIAIAGWVAWRAHGFGPLLWLWLLQLGLNAAPGRTSCSARSRFTSALIDISALWLAILAFIVVAWPVRRSAALLFVPYFLWVTFAAALNFEIWRLNADPVALSAVTSALLVFPGGRWGALMNSAHARLGGAALRPACAPIAAPPRSATSAPPAGPTCGKLAGFSRQAVAPVRRSFPVVYLKLLRAPIRETVAFAEDPTYRGHISFVADRHRYLLLVHRSDRHEHRGPRQWPRCMSARAC